MTPRCPIVILLITTFFFGHNLVSDGGDASLC